MEKFENKITQIPLKEQESMADGRPFVSVILPAYNEAAIIERSLTEIYSYMQSLEENYRWELIIVNDGSSDNTGELAEAFAQDRKGVVVLHHAVNFRLGQALRYAFNNCHGDYVVVMDMDLTYSTEHIGALLDAITAQKAKIVIASPYMKGGQTANIPWLRKQLSVWANKFLSIAAKGNLSTYTGMVRAYDRKFIQSLSLRSMDMSINAEIIYKAMLLNARIVEIPARLDWSSQEKEGVARQSSMKIRKSIFAYLLSGFMFRPFIFFILPGFLIMWLSFYSFFWVCVHTISKYGQLQASFGPLDVRISESVAQAFQQSPHTFIIGGISLMLAIQLISLGIMSLQNKKNFEDIFQLCSDTLKASRQIE